MQIEIKTKENRVALFSLMDELGYAKYGLRFGRLTALDDVEALSFQDSDFYFLPHAKPRHWTEVLGEKLRQ